jgi:hypothetical protein
MNEQTINLILALLPIAQRVAVQIGTTVIDLKEDMAKEDIIKALEQSRSATWPDYDFGPKDPAQST